MKIRPFRLAEDLDDAHRVFISGFYHLFWPLMDEADPSLTATPTRGRKSGN